MENQSQPNKYLSDLGFIDSQTPINEQAKQLVQQIKLKSSGVHNTAEALEEGDEDLRGALREIKKDFVRLGSFIQSLNELANDADNPKNWKV